MTFATFLIVVMACYAAQGALMLLGLARLRDRRFDVSPSVSVVVAARNEEENIGACLSTVLDQTYPSELFEVLVVDDDSTDRTRTIAAAFQSSHPNLRIVDAPTGEELRGKPNALAAGIDACRGEVVMITDADCTVPRTWIAGTARRYGTDVGLVGGVTLQKSADPFSGMQSLDWAFILGLASSSAAIGYPLGSIGNNLSFRKAAYEDAGGYRKLKFSVTEDYAVVQAIIRTGRWRYAYPVDPELLVTSQACPDIRTLLRQKHRWGKGGLDMKLGGLLIMVIGFLIHTAPFIMLYWHDFLLSIEAIIVKIVIDYIFLHTFLKKLNKLEELKYFYWFELYFSLYVVALPFLVLFGGKVRWKGRTF